MVSSCFLDRQGQGAPRGSGGENAGGGGSANGGNANGGRATGGTDPSGGRGGSGATGGMGGAPGGSGGAPGGSGGMGGSGGNGSVDCGTDLQDPMTMHCYRSFDTQVVAVAARALCQALGPRWDIAAITTFEELEVVTPLFASGSGKHVGANDNDVEGDWRWVTGEAWNFTLDGGFWHNNEPSGGQGENCGELWNANPQFNDVGCNDLRGYLCERSAP